MHQSPLKQPIPRREKHLAAFDALDADEPRPFRRSTQPKARKFSAREDGPRSERSRQHPRG